MDSPGADGGNRNQSCNKQQSSEGKSCKGYLFYSSVLNSKSQNPKCFGISRTLQQVPNYIVEETEAEWRKTAQQLMEFRYSCIGYSVYMNKKAAATAAGDGSNKQPNLPFCVGIEVLMNKKAVEPSGTSVDIYAQRNKDGQNSTQPRINKPAPAPASASAPAPSSHIEFLNRFSRNASLVASGVVKNANKVCNQIKSTIDDILYPYRRPPK